MNKYKYVGQQEVFVAGIGLVRPNQTFETDQYINSSLFEQVKEEKIKISKKTK